MNLDRTAQGAAAFVASLSPRRLYALQWPGVVVAQGGPDSFDFQPDDPRMPGVSGVPMRLPVPGVTVTVDPAQSPRAVLAFAQGDPSKPELHLWERPGLQRLDLAASAEIGVDAPAVNLGDATAAVGRVGDAVGVPVSATALIAWLATVGTVTGAGPFPGGFTISSGSNKVKA